MESSPDWPALLASEPRLLDAARKQWESPTQIQREAIPAALSGKDILARAPTGSGKTAAYIIPILIGILRSPLPWCYKALILVPTRELCRQVKTQFDELSRYCHISAAHLGDDGSIASQKVALAANPPAVLIGTPARIVSFNFFDSVAFLVIDEADQQLGLDHGPDIEMLISKLPSTRQSFLMSATLGDEVERLQTLVLNDPLRLDITDDVRSSLLSHYYLVVASERRFEVLYGLIQTGALGRRVLIFVNTTTGGYKLRLFFERFGIKSSVLNAQLPVASRIHILQEFNRGSIDMLVAIDETDEALTKEFSAARGVDFRNLDAVLNFDVPQTVGQYIHRVGRTARGMREGAAVTFVESVEQFAQFAEFVRQDEGVDVAALNYNVKDAEIFSYRVNGVLTSITRKQIKECKKEDIKREILNSERLQAHFEENPADLKILKHDSYLFPTKVDRQLKVIPEYLGSQIKRQQHPLTQKAKQAKSAQTRNQLAKLDAINRALKRHKKKKK
jgi:ATP-dependent RNA helicase DDX56/DBP9